MPRRWATRTSKQTKNIVEELNHFICHSNKIEFTAQRLERNLKSIFHSPNVASDSNHDSTANNLEYLAQLTPENITKTLANRQDITPVEVSEISDRIIVVKERLSEEIDAQQKQINELAQESR